MIIAAVQPWLRRSDQAVRWARNMLRPGHAVIVDTQAADLPGNLCEIAVIDTTGEVLLDTLINPHTPISCRAARLHGLDDDMVATAPTFPAVLHQILAVTNGRQVLAYNAPLDREALVRDAHRSGQDSDYLEDPDAWGCIMRARSAWAGTPDHFYPLVDTHRARDNALAALTVLQAIADDSALVPVAGRRGLGS